MKLKDYFRDELNYLRKQGKAFARHNPKLANTLGEQAADPDVERLLEGFAFLTAKLRYKIEDDFPELTRSMLQVLWPNYLRPIPSATIMRFSPVAQTITQRQVLPKGTEVLSRPVDGISCRFRTCADVNVYPLEINSISDAHSKQESVIRFDLRTLSQQPLNTIDCDELTFYINSDDTISLTLYLWLAKYIKEIRFIVDGKRFLLNSQNIVFPGFSPNEALLPYPPNVYDGYRILQEYFFFPQRFYFFQLNKLSQLWPNTAAHNVTCEISFSRPMPPNFRLRQEDLVLGCAPAINLFKQDANPISLSGKAVDYRLEPSVLQPKAFEIFSVDHVLAWGINKEGERSGFLREFYPFESFQHEIEFAKDRVALYYRLKIEESVEDEALNYKIAFVRSDETYFIEKNEIISIETTCTNRELPLALGIGDINVTTDTAPSFATYSNITRPTPPCRPVLDGSLHWTLISNMSLNYLSLQAVEPIKTIVSAYDFSALYDMQHARSSKKRLEAIKDIHTSPMDYLMKGFPVRGMKTVLKIDGAEFLCEGELYLFGSVLSEFFSLYPSINSFHQLEIINLQNNEHYVWPIRNGKQPII